MVSEWSDLDLVRAIADGDERAMRACYERHAAWLAVRLRRSLPAAAVEDVLQETFVAIWQGASRYDGGGEPAAWFWGIARRQAAMWLRKHGRPELSLDESRLAERSGTSDPVHDALNRLEWQQALHATGPPGSAGRDLAHRVFLQDQSIGEVADALQIPTGTVKSRIFALRRRMRAAVGREDDAR